MKNFKKNSKKILVTILSIVIICMGMGFGTTNTVDASSYSYSTVYNGVDYASVFNADYYYNHYTDLQSAIGYNPEALLAHFVNYGISEGRQGSANFNVSIYKSLYSDLQAAFGNNTSSYYYHYISNGQYEGRTSSGQTYDEYANTVYNGVDYSAVFNAYSYYLENPDLQSAFGYNPQALLAHFVNYGMNEGRDSSVDFNFNYYKSAYSDLRSAFGNNSKSYYLHYINNGQYEGRSSNSSNTKYITCTYYNGVDYSKVFNAYYYYSKYSDLKSAIGYNPQALLAHFLTYGVYEGRQASSNFSISYYMVAYSDLTAAFGSNTFSYLSHYINNGYSEGRTATTASGWQTIDGRIYYFENGVKTSLTGIDVSQYQGTIDWEAVQADGIDYAIIRIGYGGNYTSQDDSKAEYNMSECERLGIPYGVYIYSYALNSTSVSSEVQHVLRMISGHTVTMGIWYDMEDADGYKASNGLTPASNGDTLTSFCLQFCNEIKSAGYSNVGVYASYNYFTNILDYDSLDSFNNIWLAHWGISSPSLSCDMWQYTSSGSVDGISTRVDMSVYLP